MTTVAAFAPGNVSGVFKIMPHKSPAKMHSLGMGFTVSDGVEVTMTRAATAVFYNGQPIDFPTVRAVMGELAPEPVAARIESTLPLSSGFGLSGACALASAYALDALFELGHAEEHLAMTAHVAEVENLTGLGDVCAQYHGGCLVKLKPGQPLAAEPLPIAEQAIYYRYFSPIRTRDVLADAEQVRRINAAADAALAALSDLSKQTSVDMDDCIRVCRRFADSSGLVRDDRVRSLIDEIENAGGAASMIMLGNAVFSTQSFAGCAETALAKQRVRLL